MGKLSANQYWKNRKTLHRISGLISAYSEVIVWTKTRLHLANDRQTRLLVAINRYEKQQRLTLTK